MAMVEDWQEDEERWDDWDQSSNGTTSLSSRRSSKAHVVGRSADPAHDPENWEADFDFEASPAVNTSRSSLVSLFPSERTELSELLATLPALDDVDPPLTFGTEETNVCTLKEICRLISVRHLGRERKSEQESLKSCEDTLAEAKAHNDSEAEVRALIEVAKAHRRSGKTGAAMLQLQLASQTLEETKKTTGQAQDLANIETQMHYEMSLTARKIRDLTACKAYLSKALVSASSAVSLSPLWSPLWLKLHSDSAETLLLLDEKKPALQHFSQFLAGIVARAPTAQSPDDSEAWRTFLSEMGSTCLYMGAILVEINCVELAEQALVKSFQAFESIPDPVHSLQVVPWLKHVRTLRSASAVSTVDGSVDGEETAAEEVEEAAGAGERKAKEQEAWSEREGSSEEEDWDAELEDESRDTVPPVPAVAKLSLFQVGQALKSPSTRNNSSLQSALLTSSTLPDRCAIARELEHGGTTPIKIVMYPTATHLFATQGRVMTEHTLYEWLDGMFQQQDRATYLAGSECGREVQETLEQRMCMALAGSAAWAALMTELCFRLKKAGRRAECWQQLERFFQGVRACTAEARAEGPEGGKGVGWGELRRPWDERAVWQACHVLLHVAAKLWSAPTHLQFQQFLFVSRTVGGGRVSGAATIKEIETIAHHSQDVSTIKSVAMPALAQIYQQAVQLEQDAARAGSASGAAAAAGAAVCGGGEGKEERGGVGDGERGDGGGAGGEGGVHGVSGGVLVQEPAAEEGGPWEMQAEALADLHLCASGLSPLTMTKLWAEVQAGKEEPGDAALGGGAAGVAGEGALADAAVTLLSNPEERMRRLEGLYLRLRPQSFLRGKCAFALGHYKLALGSKKATPAAEQLLFEAAYLLHRTAGPVPGVSLLVSCLGEAALTKYADALLAAGKHMYAVLALEAAARCHVLRTGEEPHGLYRRLTLVCADHGEYRRSFEYYSKVRVEGQVNEFLFLSERVADLYMHLGDFASAETALLSASNLIKGSEALTPTAANNTSTSSSKSDSVTSTSSASSIISAFSRTSNTSSPPAPEPGGGHLDSRYLGLQLRLAKVMLAGCDRARGILLLESLAKASLSRTPRLQTSKLLASGLYHADRTREALALIKHTRERVEGRPSAPADRFWLLSLEARCHLRAHDHRRALQVLDRMLSSEHRVSALGHLFVLRGRTLLAAAHAGKPLHGASPAASAFAAADAFFSAWELYRTVGARVPEAKAAARFVEAKLWAPGLLVRDRMWDEATGTPRLGPVRASPFESPVLQRTRRSVGRGPGGEARPPIWKRQLSDPAQNQAMDPDARASVEKAAALALEAAVASCGELRLLLRAQLNLAELLWVQGREGAAMNHFGESRDLFCGLFLRPDGTFILSAAPPSYTRACLAIARRMVRFVASAGAECVAHNTALLDLLLHLEWLCEAGAPHDRAPDALRVWSLLHQLRAGSRGLLSSAERRLDEVQRQNISVLRQIHQITSRPSFAALSPAPAHSQRAGSGDGGASAGQMKRSGSWRCNTVGKVYIIQLAAKLVVAFCKPTGRLEVCNLEQGEAVASEKEVEGLRALLLDDAEAEAACRERLALGAFQSGLLAQTLKAALTDLFPSPAAGKPPGTPTSCASEDDRHSQSSESTEGGGSKGSCAPVASKPARGASRSLLGQLGSLASAPFRRSKLPTAKLLSSSTDLALIPEAPVLLACSPVLRSLPWERAMPAAHPLLRVVECRLRPAPPRPNASSAADKKPPPRAEARSHFLALHQKQPTRAEVAKLRAARGAMVELWAQGLVEGSGVQEWPAADSSVLCPQLKQKKLYGLQRKYLHVAFLDAAPLAANPAAILPLLDDSHPDPLVLLVPLHALVRLPQALMIALAHRPGFTLAFCPQAAIKRLARTIEVLNNPPKTPLPKPSAPSAHASPDEDPEADPRQLLLRAARIMHDKFGVTVTILSAAPYARPAPAALSARSNTITPKSSAEDTTPPPPAPPAQPRLSLKRQKSRTHDLPPADPLADRDPSAQAAALAAGSLGLKPCSVSPETPDEASEERLSAKKARKSEAFDAPPESPSRLSSLPEPPTASAAFAQAVTRRLSECEVHFPEPTEPDQGNSAQRFSILAPSVSPPLSLAANSPSDAAGGSLSALSLSQTRPHDPGSAEAGRNPLPGSEAGEAGDPGAGGAAGAEWQDTVKLEVSSDSVTAQSLSLTPSKKAAAAQARRRRRRLLESYQRSTAQPPFGPERSSSSSASSSAAWPPARAQALFLPSMSPGSPGGGAALSPSASSLPEVDSDAGSEGSSGTIEARSPIAGAAHAVRMLAQGTEQGGGAEREARTASDDGEDKADAAESGDEGGREGDLEEDGEMAGDKAEKPGTGEGGGSDPETNDGDQAASDEFEAASLPMPTWSGESDDEEEGDAEEAPESEVAEEVQSDTEDGAEVDAEASRHDTRSREAEEHEPEVSGPGFDSVGGAEELQLQLQLEAARDELEEEDEAEKEGEGDSDGHSEGERDGDGKREGDGDMEGEGDGDGKREGDGDMVGEGDGDGKREGDGDIDGEGDGDGKEEGQETVAQDAVSEFSDSRAGSGELLVSTIGDQLGIEVPDLTKELSENSAFGDAAEAAESSGLGGSVDLSGATVGPDTQRSLDLEELGVDLDAHSPATAISVGGSSPAGLLSSNSVSLASSATPLAEPAQRALGGGGTPERSLLRWGDSTVSAEDVDGSADLRDFAAASEEERRHGHANPGGGSEESEVRRAGLHTPSPPARSSSVGALLSRGGGLHTPPSPERSRSMGALLSPSRAVPAPAARSPPASLVPQGSQGSPHLHAGVALPSPELTSSDGGEESPDGSHHSQALPSCSASQNAPAWEPTSVAEDGEEASEAQANASLVRARALASLQRIGQTRDRLNRGGSQPSAAHSEPASPSEPPTPQSRSNPRRYSSPARRTSSESQLHMSRRANPSVADSSDRDSDEAGADSE